MDGLTTVALRWTNEGNAKTERRLSMQYLNYGFYPEKRGETDNMVYEGRRFILCMGVNSTDQSHSKCMYKLYRSSPMLQILIVYILRQAVVSRKALEPSTRSLSRQSGPGLICRRTACQRSQCLTSSSPSYPGCRILPVGGLLYICSKEKMSPQALVSSSHVRDGSQPGV